MLLLLAASSITPGPDDALGLVSVLPLVMVPLVIFVVPCTITIAGLELEFAVIAPPLIVTSVVIETGTSDVDRNVPPLISALAAEVMLVVPDINVPVCVVSFHSEPVTKKLPLVEPNAIARRLDDIFPPVMVRLPVLLTEIAAPVVPVADIVPPLTVTLPLLSLTIAFAIADTVPPLTVMLPLPLLRIP